MASPAAPPAAALEASDPFLAEPADLKDATSNDEVDEGGGVDDALAATVVTTSGAHGGPPAHADHEGLAIIIVDVDDVLVSHLPSSSAPDGNADECSRQAKAP